MKLLAGGTVALALAMTMVAQAGQTPPQPPTTTQPSAQAPAAEKDAKEVTIVGCVQREADYRKEKSMGSGGAAGTGAGVGNEFVLTNASLATKGSGETAGTAGSAPMAGSAAFELTGSGERQAEQFVGKRVEIIGKLKPAEMGASGPTGGATAGEPPKGVDAASKDLKLREIDVTSVREASGGGSCPASAPR